jgi:predicted metal-dependent hydrolase
LKAVYPVADFLAALPAPLIEHARAQPDSDALAQQCAAPPPPLVLRGLREFNRREFYECHETLEEAWMAESGPVRDLYRVILQVSVAYYHILNENYNGAIKMFLRAVQWFAPLPDSCQGIDIAALRENVTAVRAHLEALGPDRIRDFDRTLLKPIRYEGMST